MKILEKKLENNKYSLYLGHDAFQLNQQIEDKFLYGIIVDSNGKWGSSNEIFKKIASLPFNDMPKMKSIEEIYVLNDLSSTMEDQETLRTYTIGASINAPVNFGIGKAAPSFGINVSSTTESNTKVGKIYICIGAGGALNIEEFQRKIQESENWIVLEYDKIIPSLWLLYKYPRQFRSNYLTFICHGFLFRVAKVTAKYKFIRLWP